ncbi:MAG: PKD domain-containing protein [Candidatus Thalassarchaeaceae archaeon]|tara:strand:+ start:679 stop:2136 length:1458 start_codon:yes stop_codon:yes gene_type:complete
MPGRLLESELILEPSADIIWSTLPDGGLMIAKHGSKIEYLLSSTKPPSYVTPQSLSAVAVTEMGIILGHNDGRIEVLSESGVEFLGTTDASIETILSGNKCAAILDSDGEVRWMDEDKNVHAIEGIGECEIVRVNSRSIAASGVFGTLWIANEGEIVHTSIPSDQSIESISCMEFRPSGILVASRRSLDGIGDHVPENRVECWDIFGGRIHCSETDHPLSSMTPTQSGVIVGDVMGGVTQVEISGQLSSRIQLDDQRISTLSCSKEIICAGIWFSIIGLRDGCILWKCELDGIPCSITRLSDGRSIAVCVNPSTDAVSAWAFNPQGDVEDEADVEPQNKEIIEAPNYGNEENTRFEHSGDEVTRILDDMNEEVEDQIVDEEDADLLEELASEAKMINLPPVADAGEDLTVTSDEDGTAEILLDGRASYDPDGEINAWEWLDERERVVGSTSMIKVRVRQGTHVFRLRVKDDKNAMSEAIVTLRVI